MKKNLLFVLLVLLTETYFSAQDDTVKVYNIKTIPTIDALSNDECWYSASWQNIDEVWLNYGETLPKEDFSGRYKTAWSSETNLLYLLIEVTDDAFIDSWPEVAGDYFAFDIIEIFIDQDKSGGLHVFDGTGQTGVEWGTNGENAFSYHINIDLPDTAEYTSFCVVNDIAGTNWSDVWNPDFADHFPEIAFREKDGKYYWEMSLKVFDDTYDFNNPEASRVTLNEGDIMGFTMAYCDNDGVDENPKTRDNFIGSVWVPAEKYNDHWMDADGYGTMKIIGKEPEVQDDPVVAENVIDVPIIDAYNIDESWSKAKWQPIKQVWIDYGEQILSSDFSGRYKVIWSAETNLLYFLVETVDDIFVDGYVYNPNPSIGNGYPNYDIVEVFIDQDNSGGLHVFDGIGNTGAQWGTNSENAFSYHIAANLNNDGSIVDSIYALDIAGTDWGNYIIANYADHIPEFAMRHEDGVYYWEFSLAVYDASYDYNKPEDSRVTLKGNDLMGLSLAYCDNDDPNENPKTRDNFIGSVYVPESAYNDHWMNADGFGNLLLVDNITSTKDEPVISKYILEQNYPNPFNPVTTIKYQIPERSFVSIKMYDILGNEVMSLINKEHNAGTYKISVDASALSSGVYLYKMITNKNFIVKKMCLIK